MPIYRRTNVPEPSSVVEATAAEDDPMDARSAALQGIRLDVYTFIRRNPLCSRADISAGLDMKSSTVTARVKELIDLGYVVEPLGMRKENNSSGVRVRCLQVSDRLMSGKQNDKVVVEVTLTIDCNGVYGATASVVGGRRQSGRATPIRNRTVTIIAPPNPKAAPLAPISKVTRVGRLNLQLGGGEIIDVPYEIVKVV